MSDLTDHDVTNINMCVREVPAVRAACAVQVQLSFLTLMTVFLCRDIISSQCRLKAECASGIV